MLSRRQALQTGMAVGALYALPGIRFAYAFAQTPRSSRYSIPICAEIGVAKADPTPAPVTGVLHYTLNIDQFLDDGVAPALGPTTLRGYSPTRLLAGQAHRHLGGIIVAHKGQPIQIIDHRADALTTERRYAPTPNRPTAILHHNELSSGDRSFPVTRREWLYSRPRGGQMARAIHNGQHYFVLAAGNTGWDCKGRYLRNSRQSRHRQLNLEGGDVPATTTDAILDAIPKVT